MKSAIHLLLAGVLAFGPLGCNKSTSPDESVSANAGRTRTESAEQPAKSDKKQPARSATERNVPRQRADDRAAVAEPKPAPPRARATETVPKGTAVTVTLLDTISTDASKEGDKFKATLAEPITVNGKVVAEKGDHVTGTVKTVDEPGRVKGRARLELVLDEIMSGNQGHNVSTEPFILVAGDNKDRDAALIAGGAGVGAVIGAVTGGKKGAALGAIIGGGSGTTAVLVTKGKQLKLEPETRVNFVLADDLKLPVIRSSNT
ncbi:MAG TPA: hypothetical protein VE422_22640 [Terriglobia bacterium]|nr:hypothetical protein [Terriglobia bacterium]